VRILGTGTFLFGEKELLRINLYCDLSGHWCK